MAASVAELARCRVGTWRPWRPRLWQLWSGTSWNSEYDRRYCRQPNERPHARNLYWTLDGRDSNLPIRIETGSAAGLFCKGVEMIQSINGIQNLMLSISFRKLVS